MKLIPSTTNQKAMALGAIAGMRAMTAPAILSNHFANSHSFFLDGSSLGYLQKSGVATGMKVLAVAELIGDKLPFTPKRIKPLQLMPRAFSGALVGATIAESNGESRITGALYGLVGAMAASYVFYYLRKNLVKVSGIPDGAFALMEDALALKVGTSILKD
ncbi:DUF4126 family protein [Rufibacter tibetensis]|uniref:DUF4126 domain-containing protein n=1 Tax=Rufibacter tibetensis TaxID=512763 RepID=A0A0N7HWY1_9BACT|nr:DUF4126 family protein [Rufibacter tibetensis]ALJ00513.1 hypothetical protein DC20_17980 [Rufibacter tibetensis]